jgi:hypothetical protein
MKTASFSLGRTLTVASRSRPNASLNVLRWDLDEIAKSEKWTPQKGADSEVVQLLKQTQHGSNTELCGTAVVITKLDRLEVKSALASHARTNEMALLHSISAHLGMVFHQFLERGLTITLGPSKVIPWNPTFGGNTRDSESLGNEIKVTSYVMPHHSKLTVGDYERMAGPLGWQRHQGFLVYRSGRLIVPGGWLRLFRAEESCKLARMAIHLPNNVDESWSLNVMKSVVTPPSWLVADLRRIADATRRQAMEVFNFRGERQAPSVNGDESVLQRAFWIKTSDGNEVRFRINRAHPIVQTLMQSMRDTKHGQTFLAAFERLLPLDAILQDPKRTTNGSGTPPSEDELKALADLAGAAVRLLKTQGHDSASATSIILSTEPFVSCAERVRALL